VADEQGNVFGALAKGRDADRKYVQAIEKVGAKFVFGDELGEIAIGGGDEARVSFECARTAEGARIRAPGERGGAWAGVRGNFADFVEEDGAVMSEFEAANALSDRAGEGAALVPKSSLSSKPVGMAANSL